MNVLLVKEESCTVGTAGVIGGELIVTPGNSGSPRGISVPSKALAFGESPVAFCRIVSSRYRAFAVSSGIEVDGIGADLLRVVVAALDPRMAVFAGLTAASTSCSVMMSPRTAVSVSTQPSMHLGIDVNVVYDYGSDGLAPNPVVTIPASRRDLRSLLAAVSCNLTAERISLYLCCAGQQPPLGRSPANRQHIRYVLQRSRTLIFEQ